MWPWRCWVTAPDHRAARILYLGNAPSLILVVIRGRPVKGSVSPPRVGCGREVAHCRDARRRGHQGRDQRGCRQSRIILRDRDRVDRHTVPPFLKSGRVLVADEDGALAGSGFTSTCTAERARFGLLSSIRAAEIWPRRTLTILADSPALPLWQQAEAPGWSELQDTTASASISTSISGEINAPTWTIDVAGRTSRKNSPCALPTFSQSAMLIT